VSGPSIAGSDVSQLIYGVLWICAGLLTLVAGDSLGRANRNVSKALGLWPQWAERLWLRHAALLQRVVGAIAVLIGLAMVVAAFF
jgi:hypothetical protein